jgi:hypothetical protein
MRKMGARTQVYIKDEKVYLYSHWDSGSIKKIVAKALVKRWRWDDPEYLARIIFEEMIGNQKGTEMGFGIGTSQHQDLDNMITIDCAKQKILYYPKAYVKKSEIFSFEDFITENNKEV